jgi:hypothetical protein
MNFGLHDANLRWERLRWQRIAVYGPVNVQVEVSTETAARPPGFPGARDASMRVLLRHEPTPCDPNAVALYTASGRRIGSLHPEVAAWVAPLLDSGRSAFEGDIWPLEAGGSERGRLVPTRTMTLIHYELSPVAQSLWSTSLRGAIRLARTSSP